MNPNIHIRKAEEKDIESIWRIIQNIISGGDTYVFDPDSPRDKMISFWCGANKHTYVALIDERVVGTFFIKENQPDLGSHVANAGYMTLPTESGKGIGKAMGEFSLREAKRLGFDSMQFNIVIKSNENAIGLWKKLGFRVVGEIPDAFDHKVFGYTNALIMWKKL